MLPLHNSNSLSEPVEPDPDACKSVKHSALRYLEFNIVIFLKIAWILY